MERKKTLTKEIVNQAIVDSFKKLNPWIMMKNPVMFVVEIGTVDQVDLSCRQSL